MYMPVLDPLSNKNGHQTCKNWQNYFADKNITFFNFGSKNNTLKNRVHNVINYNDAYLQLEQNQS